MSKLTTVTVNGISYLGNLKEKNGKVFIFNSMPQINIPATMEDFTAYLKAKNLKQLEPMEFGGNGINYSISKLQPSQNTCFKICKLHMKNAKATAHRLAENEVFDSLLGK